jgi:4-hydroxysphinganine ceramide fatty acyl 2-hydroxylase
MYMLILSVWLCSLSLWTHRSTDYRQKMEGKQRTLRIFNLEDLVLQRKQGQCWIVRKGRVYNVTEFVNDHPGGDDLITQFAGMDIGNAMEDEDEHVHSESAYAMLEEYLVGKLGNDTFTVSEGQSASRPLLPSQTRADHLYGM